VRPEPGSQRVPGALWPVAVIASVGLVLAHLAAPDGAPGNATYLAALVIAGVAALVGARRKPAGSRAPWYWIASGLCLSALGDLTFSAYVQFKGLEPDVSAADLPWLASYIAISVGLLMLLRLNRRSDGADVDGLIDMAVVGVVAFLIVWQVSVQSTVTDRSVPIAVRAVWASYPILDAALLALVVRTAQSRIPGAFLLTAGVLAWLFSDFFYMLFPESVAWVPWLDAGWMIGALAMAAAIGLGPSRHARPVRDETIGPGRVALAIAPLLVPGIIEVVAHSRGVDPDPLPMLCASVVLACLAFVRAVRLLRSSQRAEKDLRAAERQFRALVQRSSDAALVLDRNGTVRYASPATHDQFGYTDEDLIGRVGWDLIHPDDLQSAVETFGAIADLPGAHASTELRIRDGAGRWRWVEEVVTNLLDDPGVEGLVANVRDISSRKAAEERLHNLAHYDPLTGLPNRWMLTEHLASELAVHRPAIAVLIVDLDQFKSVNDSRGHAVGDDLLTAVANRLAKGLPDGDTIARHGGDEFAVLARGVDGVSDAQKRAAAVASALADSITVPGGGTFQVTASVGIACASDGQNPDELLQQADTAMYAAKAQGVGKAVVFDEQLRREADELLTIQSELRTALRAGQLVVHYQPVIDLRTGTIEGVEALVRWSHPERGLLLPGSFIPVAEKSELIDDIGAFVLEQACSDASWWARSGQPLSVAVNISATQLRQEGIGEIVRAALYNSGLAANLLVIEITETAVLLAAERARSNIDAIHALGSRVALDDFGTGYSSLAFLKGVPADIVKIDRSFITDIETNRADREIVATIITLAQVLGRTVVAEGIETEYQRRELRRLGCTLAQGHLWSPAVAAEHVLPLQRRFAGSSARFLDAPS
jgi:diguanylate cyclase (GGDEF)-like protein/PAS domain S-box-containing protein